ncbi:7981_t:CDS:2 [Diversispora eburnea]|uniref:7981_t:CDS:1 n=1 Tax=Diversispora eburnea TaxID=1213867 RepID=A0A9N8ZQR6_9GLOM|nr:7981_t:CDS:2 [Diversispora eburnea]
MYKYINTLVGVVMVVTFITVSAAKKYFQLDECQHNENEKKEAHKKETIAKKRLTHFSHEGCALASLWNSQRPLGECNKPFKSSPLVPDEEKQDMNIVISSRFIRHANTSVLKICDQKMNDQGDDNQYNDEERYDDKYEEIYANGNCENRESNSICYKNSQNKKSDELVKCDITDEEKSKAANYLVHSFDDLDIILKFQDLIHKIFCHF